MEILFWPFMIASLILSILGLRKSKLFIISSILVLPLSLYLAAIPRFEVWGLIFPFFYVGAAVSLTKKIIWLAILLVSPNFFLIGWIGFIVLNQ